MNSTQIQRILRANFNHDYVLENQYIFYWESDYFGITKTGYVWEIEVKISVSDFRADFQKNFKHRCLRFNKQKMVAHENKEAVTKRFRENIIPNRFFYAVPSGLVEKVKPLVPKYAGLLAIHDDRYCNVVNIKNAPLLHREKMLEPLKTTLLSKFYWLSERQRIELKQRQRRFEL